MTYDFTTVMDRRGRDALAVDVIPFPDAKVDEGFDVIPMWIADMNFATVPTIQEHIIERVHHPAYGYFNPSEEYYSSIIDWQKKRNGVDGLTAEAIGYENWFVPIGYKSSGRTAARNSNNFSTFITTVRTKINDMVSSFDNIKIMLNNKNGITFINKSLKNINQPMHVSCMKTCCRLIKNVNCFTGRRFSKLGSRLNSLCLTT